MSTGAIADWPVQSRLVELVDSGNGTLSAFATLVDHSAPPDPTDAEGLWRLASIHREVAANDPYSGTGSIAAGESTDRNVELVVGYRTVDPGRGNGKRPSGRFRSVPDREDHGGTPMAQLLEVPELESWFLVQRRDPEHPAVLMEFETQEEAEDALCAAFAELTVRMDDETEGFLITICPALTMLEDPALRDALAVWDAQLEELDATMQRMMDA